MLSKCPPSLRYTYFEVSSAMPSNSLASSSGAKRGESQVVGPTESQATFFGTSANVAPASCDRRGLNIHQPKRTLNTVIRNAVAGLVGEPQLGLAAAHESATGVAT